MEAGVRGGDWLMTDAGSECVATKTGPAEVFSIFPGIKFIGGLPMKPATKRLAGEL